MVTMETSINIVNTFVPGADLLWPDHVGHIIKLHFLFKNIHLHSGIDQIHANQA